MNDVFTVENKWKVFCRCIRVSRKHRRVVFHRRTFSSGEFTEDLLEEHEKELQDIQTYYLHNQTLFESLAQWHESWAEYREFQRHASDPDRFKRRGYSAVQEEKQRKNLEFTLKKLQDAVLQLSKDYENEFGRKFSPSFVAALRFSSSFQIHFSSKACPFKIFFITKKKIILKKRNWKKPGNN